MRFRLIPDAGAVARRAWSMWAFYLLALLQVLPQILETLGAAFIIPPGWLFLASLTAALAGAGLRLIEQRSLSGFLVEFGDDESGAVPRRGAAVTAGAAGLAALVAFVGPWEGLRLTPYRDVAGVPTVCYGETSVPMRTYSEAECRAMFAERLVEFEAELDRCLAPPGPIPDRTKIALVSWTYNVGASAACSSTLVRLANAGDLVGACEQLPRWNRAGGRVVQGLVNRRAAERELCLAGLSDAPPRPEDVIPVADTLPPETRAEPPAGEPRPLPPVTPAIGAAAVVLILGAGLLFARRRR